MAAARPGRSSGGPIGRILWAVLVLGIGAGAAMWAGDGLKIGEPGWFDHARTKVQHGVDHSGQVGQTQLNKVQPEVDKHFPTATATTPPAQEPR